MKPRIPITSSAFRYFSSADTSVARTFARVRREQKAAEAAANATVAQGLRKVALLPVRAKVGK